MNYASRIPNGESAQVNLSALLRYGLLDDLEMRFFFEAFKHTIDYYNPKGFGTQIFDLKWHIVDEQEKSILPAMAIEVALQTDLLKYDHSNDLLPSLSINFDQNLPFGITFEYNIGFVTQTNKLKQMQAQLALSWEFQREIYHKISAFIHGSTNTASGATASAIGGGVQWTPSNRFTLFSNVNAGLTRKVPDIFIITGFAIAF